MMNIIHYKSLRMSRIDTNIDPCYLPDLPRDVYAYTFSEGVVRMSLSNSVRRLLHSARAGAAVIATAAIAVPVMAMDSAAITADHVRLVDQCDVLFTNTSIHTPPCTLSR